MAEGLLTVLLDVSVEEDACAGVVVLVSVLVSVVAPVSSPWTVSIMLVLSVPVPVSVALLASSTLRGLPPSPRRYGALVGGSQSSPLTLRRRQQR